MTGDDDRRQQNDAPYQSRRYRMLKKSLTSYLVGHNISQSNFPYSETYPHWKIHGQVFFTVQLHFTGSILGSAQWPTAQPECHAFLPPWSWREDFQNKQLSKPRGSCQTMKWEKNSTHVLHFALQTSEIRQLPSPVCYSAHQTTLDHNFRTSELQNFRTFYSSQVWSITS